MIDELIGEPKCFFENTNVGSDVDGRFAILVVLFLAQAGG